MHMMYKPKEGWNPSEIRLAMILLAAGHGGVDYEISLIEAGANVMFEIVAQKLHEEQGLSRQRIAELFDIDSSELTEFMGDG